MSDVKVPTVTDGAITNLTADIVSATDYYPFGMQMPGRSFSSNSYRYGFGGHEKDDEVKGEGNHYSFGDYGYDPRINRRWNVDPMFNQMPSWSPYAAFRDNPIMFIDPDGRIPYPITIRAFAPFTSFGFGFHGDGAKRGFTTSSTATARIHQTIDFDTDKTTLKTSAFSSPTYKTSTPSDQETGIPRVGISAFRIQKSGDVKKFTIGTSVAAGNPMTPAVFTPDINVFSNLSITENKKTGTLSISGELTGDNFPSTEAFITDPSGQNLFIGVGQIGKDVGRNTGPFTELPGENKDNSITKFSFTTSTDADGNFTGVKSGGKSYSVADWNKQFTDTKPVEE